MACARRLSFFCSVLGYSRPRQITFSASERFPALAIGLASNLEQIGGVPHKALFNNPRMVCVGEVARLAQTSSQGGIGGRGTRLVAAG